MPSWFKRLGLAACAVCLLGLTVQGYASRAQASGEINWEAARLRMVRMQLEARDITSRPVLDAMSRVPRHLFVPLEVRPFAYEDTPLPIGQSQSISQPYIVAYMTEALQTAPDQTVLEIGTGSGYQAAVLAELVHEVYTIEIIPELADRARKTLAETGYRNVYVRTGNGYLGWPEHAPFPRIIVTAAPAEIPQTLLDQLAIGGIMVIPVGTGIQDITVITKTAEGVIQKKTLPVRFVPMVDKQ